MMSPHTADTAVSSSSDTVMRHSMDPWHRPRRGSLPLKKRRLSDMYDDPRGWESPIQAKSFDNSLRTISFGGNGDEQKIAALALVAAATARASEPLTITSLASSASEALFATSLSDVDYARTTSEPSHHHHIIQDEQMHDGMFNISATSEQQRPSLVQRSSSSSSEDNTSSSKRQRVHHPPLTEPLPNGCHGRTSRNNSYCRRHPRYNGSKYCKLHYQQYIVAGTRTPPTGKQAADPTRSSSNETTCALIEAVAAIEKGVEPTPPTTTTTTQQQHHQDKRFTGCGDETRCQATTTRGRACAYVSVNDTKYCFLHADYDTNPPPRRGGNNPSGGAKTKPDASEDAVVRHTEGTAEELVRPEPSFETPPPRPRATMAVLTPHTSPPSVTSEESSCASTGCTGGHRSVSGTKKTANAVSSTTSPSPRPLLSSISSDQWFDKPVMVSTGPLANRTGRVVKWGNGWVTVRIATGTGQGVDGLTHNRRSVELLLLPDDQEGENEDAEGVDPQVTTVEDESEDGDLLRCVSRDTDAGQESTPPISLVVREKPTIHHVSEETEETDPRGSAVSPDGTVLVTEEKQGTDTHRQSTPVQEQQEAHQGTGETPAGVAPAPQLVTPKPETPRSSDQDSSVEKSIPLVESLLAAQQGRGGRKYNLDLLFGTAALERSRRTIHKPTRYEDTAMLEKKRGRLHPEGMEDSTTPSKRRRPDLSPGSSKRLSPHCVPSSPRNRA